MSKITTQIITIADQGIQIPKTLLEQAHLKGQVELEAQTNQIVIRAAKPRQGWGEAFQQAQSGSDRLLDEITATTFDETEWEW